MPDIDTTTFDQFARRFAAIEALVPDVRPVTTRSRHRRRASAVTWLRLGVAAAVVLLLGGIAWSVAGPLPPPSPILTEPPASIAGPTAAPSVLPTEVPPGPSAEPTIDLQGVPPSTVAGWWGSDVDNGSSCRVPALFRIAGGQVDTLGGCNNILFDPSTMVIDLAVGQDLEVHLAVPRDGAPPLYPLATSTDPLVIRSWFIADTATLTYRALSPGTARLMTNGPCLVAYAGADGAKQIDGPCPVADISVADIQMDCGDVPRDVCRSAAAEAVLWPTSPKGRVVAWTMTRTPYRDCSSVPVVQTFDVMLTWREPGSAQTVSVGQRELGNVDPRNFLVCTY